MKIRHALSALVVAATASLAIAGPASATHPGATATVSCVDGKSLATIHVTPLETHGLAVLSGNTYGAFTETFGPVPPAGMDLATKVVATGQTISLGVQFIFEVDGGRAEIFTFTLAPACAAPPTVATTVAATPDTTAATTTTTVAVADATTTVAAVVVTEPTTSTTGAVEATSVTVQQVTLPATGAHGALWDPRQPSHAVAYALLILGVLMVRVARRRLSLLTAPVSH